MIYFHGGVPGLKVGQLLLPPDQTGVKGLGQYGKYADGVYRRDRIYLVIDRNQARMFAALHPSGTVRRGGDVYRVEPQAPVEPDLDCMIEGWSWQAPTALIVAIVDTNVRRAPYEKLLRADIAAQRAAEGTVTRRFPIPAATKGSRP